LYYLEFSDILVVYTFKMTLGGFDMDNNTNKRTKTKEIFNNLDTSMCSFNYITSWAEGDIKIVLELGNKIQKTATDFIKKLETEFENKNIKIAS